MDNCWIFVKVDKVRKEVFLIGLEFKFKILRFGRLETGNY